MEQLLNLIGYILIVTGGAVAIDSYLNHDRKPIIPSCALALLGAILILVP